MFIIIQALVSDQHECGMSLIYFRLHSTLHSHVIKSWTEKARKRFIYLPYMLITSHGKYRQRERLLNISTSTAWLLMSNCRFVLIRHCCHLPVKIHAICRHFLVSCPIFEFWFFSTLLKNQVSLNKFNFKCKL